MASKLIGSARRNWLIVAGLIGLFVPTPPPTLPPETNDQEVVGVAPGWSASGGLSASNDPKDLTLGDIEKMTNLSGSGLQSLAAYYGDDSLVHQTDYGAVNWYSSDARLSSSQAYGLLDAAYAYGAVDAVNLKSAMQELVKYRPQAEQPANDIYWASEYFAATSSPLASQPSDAGANPTPLTESEIESLVSAIYGPSRHENAEASPSTKDPRSSELDGQFEIDVRKSGTEIDLKGSVKDVAGGAIAVGAVVARPRKKRKPKGPAQQSD